MRAIEFKSKIRNQSIYIPKMFQPELKDAVGKNVRVMIFLDEDLDSSDCKSINSTVDYTKDEMESINRGLKDFEDGRIHSNETVRKLYAKYL
jgi:hypothetical protein